MKRSRKDPLAARVKRLESAREEADPRKESKQLRKDAEE
jgi:hypothetical protein